MRFTDATGHEMQQDHREDGQVDLFLPQLTALPLRDQRETMERPFFSLSKRKRLKPIDYVSASGPVRFDAHGDVGGTFAEWQIQDGKIDTVKVFTPKR